MNEALNLRVLLVTKLVICITGIELVLYKKYCIVLFYIEGVVIAAQCTVTFQIYCASPNLGIRT